MTEPMMEQMLPLLHEVWRRGHGRDLDPASAAEVESLLRSYEIDRQDAPIWPLRFWRALLDGEIGVIGFEDESDVWNGGALFAILLELAPLFGWRWRHEGEFATLQCAGIPFAALFQFEGSGRYRWLYRIISDHEFRQSWAYQGEI